MSVQATHLTLWLVLHPLTTFCIWPPPYKINLTHSENFIIFETFGSENDEDIYSDDDEMIRKPDIRSFKIERDAEKYYRIHRMAMLRDVGGNTNTKKPRQVKWKEYNHYKKERTPWTAGFFNENSTHFRENSNVFYLNEMAKNVIEDTINRKREGMVEPYDEKVARKANSKENDAKPFYDYESLKEDFQQGVRAANASNDTLNFVDVPDEDPFLKKLIPFQKTPRNCTKEELSGIGVAAAECFWIDFKKTDTKEHRLRMVKRIFIIILIWFCVYLLIAIPCWCQRGWCCCCFQCLFCKPRRRIDEVKRFIAYNPPGVYHDEGETVIQYQPTHYEIYAHKRLEHAIMKL